MRIIKFDLQDKKDVLNAVIAAREVLRKGGVVVHPTDTCYGVAADISSLEGIEKVYWLKNRDNKKPFFIIVSDFTQFKKFGCFSNLAKEVAEGSPERMHTFVVPRKKIVPKYLNPGLKTIGIQIPKNIFSLRLLKELKNSVIGTSANISGSPAIYSVDDLMGQLDSIQRYPDLILDAGNLPIKEPSTVIEIKKGEINTLR